MATLNLRNAAYHQLLTLTLAGAVTHIPPPILAADDEDVEQLVLLQILQFFARFHSMTADDSRRLYEPFTSNFLF